MAHNMGIPWFDPVMSLLNICLSSTRWVRSCLDSPNSTHLVKTVQINYQKRPNGLNLLSWDIPVQGASVKYLSRDSCMFIPWFRLLTTLINHAALHPSFKEFWKKEVMSSYGKARFHAAHYANFPIEFCQITCLSSIEVSHQHPSYAETTCLTRRNKGGPNYICDRISTKRETSNEWINCRTVGWEVGCW